MFASKKNAIVQKEMDRLVLELESLAPDDYEVTLSRLTVLNKLKDQTPEPLSPNTIVMGGVNLLGIAMIIRHEQLNVIATKALSFVTKVK
jgi:hypothetical protein